MTAEEFTQAADQALSPAIERLVSLAFQTIPAENVEALVVSYLDMMKQVAVGAVRSIIAEHQN